MKLIIISLCVLLLSVVIKSAKREFSLFLVLSGICILFIGALSYILDIVKNMQGYISMIPDTEGYFKPVFKALALTLISQLAADLCRDNGESALAQATETVSKAVIIVMIFPLFETVLSIVNGLNK